MDFSIELELWEDAAGLCPPGTFIENLPEEHGRWVRKRNRFFERHKLSEIMRSPYFTKAQGTSYLWELRYVASGGRNFRGLAFVWKEQVVVLEMFKGSGSGGQLQKHISVALERAEDWKRRHP